MYAEVDFLLALLKDDDWLADRAEELFDRHREDLWTSHYALVELMLVAYREDLNVERVVANTNALLEVHGDTETVLAAASHVQEHGLTPLDALHLVSAGEDTIVSSDGTYDDHADRIPLEG